MGNEQVIATMSMQKVVAGEQNIFTFAAAKAGSKCFGTDGTKYLFTREALKVNAASFVKGITTLNHKKDDGGEILAAWFDDETDLLMMNVHIPNDETAARMVAGESTGVSIEGQVNSCDTDKNILDFNGTGISVMFYPEQPACPLEDGCGIIASEQIEHKIVTAGKHHAEIVNAQDYDLVRINEIGNQIKISEIYLWNDEVNNNSTALEKELGSYVGYYGAGVYHVMELTDTKIGDNVIGTPKLTVSINIDEHLGGTLMATEIETIPKTDYDEVVAKLTDAQSEIDILKADEHVKAKDIEIAAKDVTIKELTDEIDRRDTEIAASMIEEIKAWDVDFSPENVDLSTITTIHASLKRAIETTASEVDEEVVASDFTAPDGTQKSNGLTIGGIVNGVWLKGNK